MKHFKWIILIEALFVLVFLVIRLKVGISSIFDIDEFAHLHWAYNFYQGERPYTDFLYFFPPVFLYFLSPLFIIFGKSLAVLTGGRVLAYIIFLLLNLVILLLVKKIRNLHTAVLTLLIFNFLPIPGEKIVQIRPDTLATLLVMTGIYLSVLSFDKYGPDIKTVFSKGPAARQPQKHPQGNPVFGAPRLASPMRYTVSEVLYRGSSKRYLFSSGLLFGLAIITVPKTVFFLPGLFLVLWVWGLKEKALPILAGLAIPAVFTMLFFLISGDFGRAIFLNTKFINQANVILGAKFPMPPNLFFYPNEFYYTQGGVNSILILTLIIYVFASIWAIVRLVSFLDKKEKKEELIELLLSISLLANLLAYIRFYPLKHVQYFIAFAPMISFYFADLLIAIINSKRKMKYFDFGFRILFIVFLFFVFINGLNMYQKKGQWTNEKTFKDLLKVQKIIPQGSFVFDLYGASLFYKDPHYVCCLSYGEFEEAFIFPFLSLPESLKKTETKYVFPYFEARLTRLPPFEERFVRDNYVIVETDPTIMVAGKIRNLKANEEDKFELVASGKYRIFWNKETAEDHALVVDGREVVGGQVHLTAGEHRIKAMRNGEVKIVYHEP